MDRAVIQRNQFQNVYDKIDGAYTDSTKTALSPNVDAAYINQLANSIQNTTNEPFKNDFQTKYNEILRLYNLREQGPDKIEDLRQKAEDDKARIDELTNLTDDQKAEYKDQIDDKLADAIERINDASNTSQYPGIESDYDDEVTAIINVASIENARNEQFRDTYNQAVSNMQNEVDEARVLNEQKAAILAINDRYDQAIIDEYVDKVNKDNYKDDEKINEIVEEAKNKLAEQTQKAVDDAKKVVKDALEDYADKSITKDVQDIIDKKVGEIDSSDYSQEKIDEIIQAGKDEIDSHYLAVEKANKLKELKEAYEEYIKNDIYSAEGLEELKAIYEDAVRMIENATTSDQINNRVSEAKDKFKKVLIQEITSGNFKYSDLNVDYQNETSDPILALRNISGMTVGTEVRVKEIGLTNDLIKAVKTLMENSNQLILKNRDIIAKYDISLCNNDVKITEYKGIYEVRILLPERLRSIENLMVIHETEEEIEVFNTVRTGNWISFKTTHFSEFSITSENIVIDKGASLDWIILLLIIIVTLQVMVILVKKHNNELRQNSYVLPILLIGISSQISVPITWILGAIIVLLLIYMMYLYINGPKKNMTKNESEENGDEDNNDEDNSNHEGITENELEENHDSETDLDAKDLNIKYNYSFDARLHLAPLESQERFSEIKNYLLSYKDVEVKKSWKYERFMYKGKPVLKAWIHGNNLKLYYNIDASKIKEVRYTIEDVSYAKMHESTPSLFVVSGPRLLEYAKELVDICLKDIAEQAEVPNVDYTVKYVKKDKLIRMNLIKINRY